MRKFGIFQSFGGNGNADDSIALGMVKLFGLALVVLLMAALVIVYSMLGVADSKQALALPDGSVRALLAFSMVLIFVCLGAFLYNGVSSVDIGPGGKTLSKITQAELDDLKSNFTVAYEPSQEPTTSPDKLFNATYYSKHSTISDDLAKQMFTTLATVFVSVISFYFGSATASSGVDKGMKAGVGGGTPPPASPPPVGGGTPPSGS